MNTHATSTVTKPKNGRSKPGQTGQSLTTTYLFHNYPKSYKKNFLPLLRDWYVRGFLNLRVLPWTPPQKHLANLMQNSLRTPQATKPGTPHPPPGMTHTPPFSPGNGRKHYPIIFIFPSTHHFQTLPHFSAPHRSNPHIQKVLTPFS